MSRTTWFVIIMVVLVCVGIVGAKLAKPHVEDFMQQRRSDSATTKGKVVVASDSWIGYFPLCSPEMKNRMRAQGYQFECADDGADYPKRMERLKKGEIKFAVSTVDADIVNSAEHQFPGVEIMVIDESKGGDAILAREEVVKNIDAIKGRNNLRVGFTPHSPSHHLLRGVSDHFDVPELLPTAKNLRIETKNSEEARKKLLAKQIDIAVLWEPDVSRALAEKGIVKILGTESTRQFVVDVLLVHRDYAASNAELVKLVLTTYFQSLKVYRDNPGRLEDEVMKETKLSRDQVKAMLKGVAWATFDDNCKYWFGIGSTSHALVETIESTVSILMNPKVGGLKKNPLPGGDPNRIVWGRFLEELFAKGPVGFTVAGVAPTTTTVSAAFASFGDAQWNALKTVGSLKIEPIMFRGATADLHLDGKAELDRVTQNIKHYPTFRIVVKGHTALSGDPDENLKLSQERADTAARYLTVTYGMDPNRIRAIGVGSKEPLPQRPDESDGAYEYRLRRVEIYLVSEVY